MVFVGMWQNASVREVLSRQAVAVETLQSFHSSHDNVTYDGR